MPLYMIERTFADQLELTSSDVKLIDDINADEGVRWLFSFLSADQRRTYCLYKAPSPDAVLSAARRAKVPADEVVEVGGAACRSWCPAARLDRVAGRSLEVKPGRRPASRDPRLSTQAPTVWQTEPSPLVSFGSVRTMQDDAIVVEGLENPTARCVRCAGSISRPRRVASSACLGPTEPARPACGSSPPCSSRTGAPPAWSGWTRCATRLSCAQRSASPASTRPWTRT